MEVPKELNTEIWDYCRLNKITNVDGFIIKLIKQGFTVEKFGATPIIKEKIVERIVEVPVEKIVERIVEVPITMVDSEMSEALKLRIAEVETLRQQVFDTLNESERLRNEFNEYKKRNKKDIYGE